MQKENNTNNIMIYWSRSLGSNGITSEGFVQSKTTVVNYVDFTYIFLLNPHHNSRHNINKNIIIIDENAEVQRGQQYHTAISK